MNIKQKIIEFLNRNLLLDDKIVKDIRSSIHDLDNKQLKSTYNILLDLDKKQTEALQKKLEEDPNFFVKMQIKAFRQIYERHIEEESRQKQILEQWLIKELSKC